MGKQSLRFRILRRIRYIAKHSNAQHNYRMTVPAFIDTPETTEPTADHDPIFQGWAHGLVWRLEWEAIPLEDVLPFACC